MKRLESHSIEDTSRIAKQWLEGATNTANALVVGIVGELGAGKTAFVKTLARELGVVEEVTSPTFVIMKEYLTTHPYWKRMIHIDLYRLEAEKEIEVLNLPKYISDPHTLICIEWPEKGAEKLLDRRISISIEGKTRVFSWDE